jgi:hypothetical protein
VAKRSCELGCAELSTQYAEFLSASLAVQVLLAPRLAMYSSDEIDAVGSAIRAKLFLQAAVQYVRTLALVRVHVVLKHGKVYAQVPMSHRFAPQPNVFTCLE